VTALHSFRTPLRPLPSEASQPALHARRTTSRRDRCPICWWRQPNSWSFRQFLYCQSLTALPYLAILEHDLAGKCAQCVHRECVFSRASSEACFRIGFVDVCLNNDFRVQIAANRRRAAQLRKENSIRLWCSPRPPRTKRCSSRPFA